MTFATNGYYIICCRQYGQIHSLNFGSLGKFVLFPIFFPSVCWSRLFRAVHAGATQDDDCVRSATDKNKKKKRKRQDGCINELMERVENGERQTGRYSIAAAAAAMLPYIHAGALSSLMNMSSSPPPSPLVGLLARGLDRVVQNQST